MDPASVKLILSFVTECAALIVRVKNGEAITDADIDAAKAAAQAACEAWDAQAGHDKP